MKVNLNVPADAPGPQGDDKPGCFGSFALLLLLLLLPLLLAATKPPKPDVGRCPKCGRSYWDCSCPID